jgi:hypothetical protein
MSEETQTTKKDIANIGERWKAWAAIVSAIVALGVLLLGGGFFYNEIWLSKILTYTILPTYDLGKQAFTGLIIENRGRVNLTNIDVILSDLGAPIQALNMPGAHEPAQIVDGGIGKEKIYIKMPRLSRGTSLAIYMLTSGPVSLQEKKNFLVSSNETVGTISTEEGGKSLIGIIASILVFIAGVFLFIQGMLIIWKDKK